MKASTTICTMHTQGSGVDVGVGLQLGRGVGVPVGSGVEDRGGVMVTTWDWSPVLVGVEAIGSLWGVAVKDGAAGGVAVSVSVGKGLLEISVGQTVATSVDSTRLGGPGKADVHSPGGGILGSRAFI
jgi:hypothetical protein